VSVTLRDHQNTYSSLTSKNKKLINAAELATVGLKRLGSLVKFDDRVQYEYLIDLHRDFTFLNQNIKYSLDKCGHALRETTTNMQFVGEILNSALADRHKKIAAQKELGLRLKDFDGDFGRCKAVIENQEKLHRQLSEGIQKLMNKASIKLPPSLKQRINREDEVEKIAFKHKKNLEKGRDVINYTSYLPKERSKIKIKSLGEEETKTIPEAPKSQINKPIAAAAVIIGVIVGSLLFKS